VWLDYPGVQSMVDAALKQPLPQNRQALNAASKDIEERVNLDAAHNVITIHHRARDFDGGEFNIHDSAGRIMDGHPRFGGSRPTTRSV